MNVGNFNNLPSPTKHFHAVVSRSPVHRHSFFIYTIIDFHLQRFSASLSHTTAVAVHRNPSSLKRDDEWQMDVEKKRKMCIRLAAI